MSLLTCDYEQAGSLKRHYLGGRDSLRDRGVLWICTMQALENKIGTTVSPPVPDPTILTTEQLLREIQTLKDYLQSELRGAVSRVQEQFSGVTAEFKSGEENKRLALDAAKEAVSKSELMATKITDGLAKRIDELRDAQQRTEGSRQGTGDSRKGVNDVIGHVVTLAALVVAIVALFLKHS